VLEARAAEVQRDAVLGGEAGTHAVADEAVVLGSARRLRVVVNAVGVGQHAEAVDAARRAVEGAERLVEPAQRPGGGTAQNDPLAPGLVQDIVEAVRAPRAEHADDVAAADVDQILRQQVAGEIVLDAAGALVATKQRHVTGVAGCGETAVEAHDVVVGVARCRRQEADARAIGLGQRQHIVVEQRAVALHRESTASEGDDLWRSGSHGLVSRSLLAGRGSNSLLLDCPRAVVANMDRRMRFKHP
jgi:hypothetical protein